LQAGKYKRLHHEKGSARKRDFELTAKPYTALFPIDPKVRKEGLLKGVLANMFLYYHTSRMV